MDIIQGIVLFILGVGAAFLAYFSWRAIQGNLSQSPSTPTNLNNLPFAMLAPSSPGISR